jgi:two-component system, OmpR family, response regulator
MRVLLACPSDVERGYLLKALSESLNSIEVVDDVGYALTIAEPEPFDCVILCVPSADSCDALVGHIDRLARLSYTPSIIAMLTRANRDERVRLLRAGADVCFVQPWSMLEIQERMLVLQRTAPAWARQRSGSVQLDPLTRELVEARQRVLLTHREYLLLECLLYDADAPVMRERLIRYAWPEKESVEPASVNLVVSRLRLKLQSHGLRARIETVNRLGYRLHTG